MNYTLQQLRAKSILELKRLKELTGDKFMLEKINRVIDEKINGDLPRPMSMVYRDKNRKTISYI